MPIFERVSADIPVTLKTSTYTILAEDNGTEVQFESSSAIDAKLPSVSAVANGFNIILRNVGSGNLTIKPVTGEVIDSETTLTLGTGEWRWIRNDGTVWKSISLSAAASVATGTWTPVLTFATPGDLNVAYSIQVGTYTKIGRVVIVQYRITTTTFTHTTASGNAQITGLPFAALATVYSITEGALSFQGITKANYTQFTSFINPNDTKIQFDAAGSAQNQDNVTAADMPTGGTVRLHGTHVYMANN